MQPVWILIVILLISQSRQNSQAIPCVVVIDNRSRTPAVRLGSLNTNSRVRETSKGQRKLNAVANYVVNQGSEEWRGFFRICRLTSNEYQQPSDLSAAVNTK